QREGPTSPGTLAAGEGVTSQAIAGVVRELERRGLVERTGGQADRRRVAVAITDTGRELLMSREHAVVDAMVKTLAGAYTPAEQPQLEPATPLLTRLADRLCPPLQAPTMDRARPDVRAFLQRYDRAAHDLDTDALMSSFADVFLTLDASTAAAVSPQA